ncbi:MAG: hypothetical protein B6D72_14355 [gamma proteobacterium symbiont of Ctena orbiculata]|nr:hypothetical protein [Candidatus Thiodiazotropha taylori]PVV09514.1 MAG: hypothetical protein B6D72_14355 [gamma proteobacterium symbiont of Ctena orbiculata]
MDKRIKELLSVMKGKEANLISDLVDQLHLPVGDQKMPPEKALRQIQDITKEAEKRLKEMKENPKCTYCGSSTDQVEYMFKHDNRDISICSRCVDRCYKELSKLRGQH